MKCKAIFVPFSSDFLVFRLPEMLKCLQKKEKFRQPENKKHLN
ncbi:hypothetical protein [Alysiella crassa]|nr:hypothetical protein [Alysiella crassa]